MSIAPGQGWNGGDRPERREEQRLESNWVVRSADTVLPYWTLYSRWLMRPLSRLSMQCPFHCCRILGVDKTQLQRSYRGV